MKAFNTVGAEVLADPDLNGVPATMLVAGANVGAKETVLELAGAIGFDAVDAGDEETAARLEDLARVWIHLALSGFGREFAFVVRAR